jgi:hypothetical protein
MMILIHQSVVHHMIVLASLQRISLRTDLLLIMLAEMVASVLILTMMMIGPLTNSAAIE